MNLIYEKTNIESILKKYFPYSPYLKKFNSHENTLLFILMQDNLKFINLLIDFEFINEEDNTYMLMYEYKMSSSKLLIGLALNDAFLISSILRFMVENIYRILYGIKFKDSNYNSIRKKSRYNMSKRLSENSTINLNNLNNLYSKYSNNLHYGKERSISLSSIDTMLKDENLIDYREISMSIALINGYWLYYIFDYLINNKNINENLETVSLKKFIKNNFSDSFSNQMIRKVELIEDDLYRK